MKTASHLHLGLVASILGCLFSMISSSRNTPAFASFPVATRQLSSSFSGARFVKVHRAPASRSTMKSELNMFMGSDGGILGIGTPEIVRSYYIYIYICIVEYHILVISPEPPTSSLFVSYSSLYSFSLVYNSLGGIFCLGSFRFVQAHEGNWKNLSTLSHLYY